MYGINTYRSRRVDTASPAQVVLLLLLEAARQMELAAQCIDGEKGDAPSHLHAARNILTELQAALDPTGPAAELVGRLGPLYTWAQAELAAGGWRRDAPRIRAVGRAIAPLIEAWSIVRSTGLA